MGKQKRTLNPVARYKLADFISEMNAVKSSREDVFTISRLMGHDRATTYRWDENGFPFYALVMAILLEKVGPNEAIKAVKEAESTFKLKRARS